jgi:hypothetical protein
VIDLDAMTWPTEAERLARLHKWAGCDCTEEAMPIDLDEVRKWHQRAQVPGEHDSRFCRFCKADWPCDAIQLADEVEGLREVVDRLTFHQIQNKKLREALEKIERGGPWDSQAIARAALHAEGGGDG